MSKKDDRDALEDRIKFVRDRVVGSSENDLMMTMREDSYNSDYRKLRRLRNNHTEEQE